jgi:hypothetical protein
MNTLKFGKHKDREHGLCLLEAAAYVAGEPHTDRPLCVCPVIAEYCRVLNDANWLNDDDRTEYLYPIVEKIINTLKPESEEWRAARLIETASRSVLPYVMMCCDRDDLVRLTLAKPDIVGVATAAVTREMVETVKLKITNDDLVDYVTLEFSVFEETQGALAMPHEMAIFDCATKIGAALDAYCERDYVGAAFWAAAAADPAPLIAENRYMIYSFAADAVKTVAIPA